MCGPSAPRGRARHRRGRPNRSLGPSRSGGTRPSVAAATGLLLCLHDNPATTHVRVSPGLPARIAALDPVGGLKAPPPDPGAAPARCRALRTALTRRSRSACRPGSTPGTASRRASCPGPGGTCPCGPGGRPRGGPTAGRAVPAAPHALSRAWQHPGRPCGRRAARAIGPRGPAAHSVTGAPGAGRPRAARRPALKGATRSGLAVSGPPPVRGALRAPRARPYPGHARCAPR